MRIIAALILTIAAIAVSSSLAQAENYKGSSNSANPRIVIPPGSESGLEAGIQAYKTCQYEKSASFFSTIVSSEPNNERARYYLGLSLQALKQFQAAKIQYDWLMKKGTIADIRADVKVREQIAEAELQRHRIPYDRWSVPPGYHGPRPAKPIIYLYPQITQKVKVQLKYKGGLCTTYPAYDATINGWSVMARPDGTLVNNANGKEYSYLFWDGKGYDFSIDTSEGFVVKGSETAQFLQATLKKLGLTPREYNEFIVYWLPKMQNNQYNFIHFAGKEYTDVARLTVIPQPDSMLRVFMMYKPLQKPISVKEQALPSFNRHGFAVIEWGGCEISH